MENRALIGSSRELVRSSQLLKSIANPMRLLVLSLLQEREANVKQLEDLTGMKQPNVSRYLRSLVKSGLVHRRKAGQRTYYSVANNHVAMMLRSLQVIIGSNERSN